MSTDPLSEPDQQLELTDERPQQFGLFHLMGLITALGFAFALLAPLFRAMSGLQALYVLVILGIEIAVVGGSYWYSSSLRQALLSQSGRRIGQSNLGRSQTRFSGRLTTALGCLFLAIVQVVISIMIIQFSPGRFPWEMLGSQVQLAFFASNSLMQLRTNRDFGAIEFFENGISLSANQFLPWKQVIVRPCKRYKHGIKLILLPIQQNFGRSTNTIFVSEPLKQYLLKHHGDLSPEIEAV